MTALKDPRFEIRKGLYSALNGAMIYNAVAVPIYDSEGIPEDATKPYVVIGNMTVQADNTKDRFGFDCTFQVDVVTASYSNNATGEKAANDISYLAQAILVPSRTGVGLSVSGFDPYVLTLETVTKISMLTGVEQITRQISLFRIKLFQN